VRRLANIFLGLGVAIGVAGVGALVLGVRPSALPPSLLDLSVYKLVFVAAGCVLAAGALVGRAARRGALGRAQTDERLALGEGSAESQLRARAQSRDRAS
jgi:hypothetical protein